MRLLLFLLLGYGIWLIVRTVWRIWFRGRELKDQYGAVHGQNRRSGGVEKPFSEIEDAEFEELDTEKRKES